MQFKKIVRWAILILSFAGFVSVASASHSWGGYHWARTANPLTLELGDNVSSSWDSYLATSATDWSVSAVLDASVKPGIVKPRTCKATTGRVEVCSEKYGSNGWLGIAQVYVSGAHITKGTVKMNDTYFNTRTYNTPAWRNLVMCQEIGHTLGLDHQDENFGNANLGTCMDYTNDPSTNQHPNVHDYDMLESIYAHIDDVNTVLASRIANLVSKNSKMTGTSQDINLEDQSSWGEVVRKDAQGRHSLYSRDLKGGEKVFTFVTWAE